MNLDVSALDRRVRLAPRADLLAALAAQSPLGGGVLTDPLTRQHYEFTAEERTLFERLRSSATLRELQRMLERAFAPRQFSPTMIAGYLSRLHSSGLLVAEGAEQAAALAERLAEQQATRRRWAWTQLLGWRLPGINPDRVLSHFTGLARLVFSPLGAVLFVLTSIAGLAVLLANFSQLVAEAPSVAELRSPQLWLRLALSLAFVKSLHELGHALACKRFGGAVPEMGVMLLALTPCLYTDVSDAWRLPRSQRLIVSGAGILVELALAALALVVWQLTEPSWLHLAALDVAFVCSFGTLLINGNPLLRYDGYYLLSDFTATPNLWSRSRIAVRQRLARWIEKPTREAVEREPTWLALYGVASQAYLTVVMVSLVWLLYQGLRGWRLEAIAVFIGGLLLASTVAPPVARGVKQLRNPLYRRRWRRAELASRWWSRSPRWWAPRVCRGRSAFPPKRLPWRAKRGVLSPHYRAALLKRCPPARRSKRATCSCGSKIPNLPVNKRSLRRALPSNSLPLSICENCARSIRKPPSACRRSKRRSPVCNRNCANSKRKPNAWCSAPCARGCCSRRRRG